MTDEELYEALKEAFRNFELSDRGREAKAQRWWPQASDLAEVAMSVVRPNVIDLRDLHMSHDEKRMRAGRGELASKRFQPPRTIG
jgi:hypothetical protein